MRNKPRIAEVYLLQILAAIVILMGCTDPVDPQFKISNGLIYIDACASNSTGSSYVQIFESDQIYGRNTITFQGGAQVRYVNTSGNEVVVLHETEDRYLPPEDFVIAEGESWQLDVVLADGRHYMSESESAVATVPVGEVKVTYDPELAFVDDYNRRVPGHQISLTYNDPPEEENYYLWQYRSYERLLYCKLCYNYTVFRDGECFDPYPGSVGAPLQDYYTYTCEEACWKIRYNDKIELFADTFSDGAVVAEHPVAKILLYQKQDILVNIQQYSVNREAYRYYKTLKDLVDNNSGFNAPLPAALLGNLYNPDNSEEYVLGRFTVAAQDGKNIFIERLSLPEDQLEVPVFAQAEEYGSVPDPMQTIAPCEEGPYRTSVMPNGWNQ
jgi:hypothetical protein